MIVADVHVTYLAPIYFDQEQFNQKCHSYERHKPYDEFLHPAVRIREEQHTDGHRRKAGPYSERQTEEDMEGNGGAKNFRHRGGDGRQHGGPENRARQPSRHMPCGRFGQTLPSGNPKVRGVMLEQDQHQCG